MSPTRPCTWRRLHHLISICRITGWLIYRASIFAGDCASLSTTPVLFYSGAVFESDKREAMEAGARDISQSPPDTDEVVRDG